MTSTTIPSTELAARRLYDAETALHAARQTGDDHWVDAAYRRLHEAICLYDASCPATVCVAAVRPVALLAAV